MGRMLTGLVLGVVAAGGTALAQDGPPRGLMGMMMRADTNGDGTVTRAEYQAQVDARFARRDANGNGRIDSGEEMRGPGMRGPEMRGPETRGSGMQGDAPPAPPAPPAGAAPAAPPSEVGLTRDQFRARAFERFDRLDANRDGKIDAAEMHAAMPMRGERPAAPPAG